MTSISLGKIQNLFFHPQGLEIHPERSAQVLILRKKSNSLLKVTTSCLLLYSASVSPAALVPTWHFPCLLLTLYYLCPSLKTNSTATAAPTTQDDSYEMGKQLVNSSPKAPTLPQTC